MRIKPTIGTKAEEFHLASSGTKTAKALFNAFELNYDEHVQELVSEAPLHIDGTTRVPLAIDDEIMDMSLEKAITTRTSGRDFGKVPLAAAKLAKILYLANAIRKAGGGKMDAMRRRNVPNAGGMGSVEIYCAVLNVEGIEPGLYHFDTVHHELRLIQEGDFSTWLQECVFYQAEFSDSSVVLFLTTAMWRLTEKYGQKGYRLGLLDAGHVSENIYLTATALNLNVCATAGFVDEEINEALRLDGLDTCAVLALAVGASPG